MRTPKLHVLLLLFSLALGQQAESPAQAHAGKSSEPALPVIDYKACPFEGCTFGKWKVTKDSSMYSTWREGRTEMGKLKTGQKVTGLTGVHITRRPYRIVMKQAIPDLGLKAGDIVLRYMYLGEGYYNIWFNGAWHKSEDCSFIAEKNTGECTDCSAVVTEDGDKGWWVKVKTADGKVGWVLVQQNFEGIDAFA